MPTLLCDCSAELECIHDVQISRFVQFVILRPLRPDKPNDKDEKPPRKKPTDFEFVGRLPDWYSVSTDLFARQTRLTARDLLSKVDFARLSIGDTESGDGLKGAIAKRLNASSRGTNFVAPTGPKYPSLSADDLVNVVRGVLTNVLTAQTKAIWAVGLQFEQQWRHQGSLRGRLVKSIPLTPGEQLEISVKTWDKRTRRESENLTLERQFSNEVTRSQNWSVATKGVMTNVSSASVTPTGGLNGNVALPIEQIKATVGGNLGLTGNLANSLTNVADLAVNLATSQTAKAIDSLKSSRINTVETFSEFGSESATKQTIANSNRCHTVTYLYFDVVDRFQISARLSDTDLYLLIPLDLPKITREWILCNECFLRRALICDTYAPGFAAAKQLAVHDYFVARRPGAPAPGAKPGAASALDAGVEGVLEAYRVLSRATLIPGAPPGGDIWDLMNQGGAAVLEGLAELADKGKDAVEDGIEAAKDLVEDGLNLVGDAIKGAGDVLGGVFARSAPGSRMAFSGGVQGGPGSFIYREVANIVAPQLMDSLRFLESAWPAARAGSELDRLSVLQTFFAKLGDPTATFRSIEVALVAIPAIAAGVGAAAGAVAGGVIGGAVGFAVTVWGFGVSAIPGTAAGIGIGAAVGALVGAGVTIAATTALVALVTTLEGLGIADTLPDDGGLKDRLQGLKAQVDAGISSPSALGNLDGSKAAIEAEVEAMAALRRELLELAEAQVEFDRLVCHLRQNLEYYMQGIWSNLRDYEIARMIEAAGVPAEKVESTFSGFIGNLGAVRVKDLVWVEKVGGLDADKEFGRVRANVTLPDPMVVDVPAPALVVEPYLGECSACEPYVSETRAIELRRKTAEADMLDAKAIKELSEAQRFVARVSTGDLSDPTPGEEPDVTVEFEPGD